MVVRSGLRGETAAASLPGAQAVAFEKAFASRVPESLAALTTPDHREGFVDILRLILQVIVALGILNVWLLRPNQPTPYRGGRATTIRGEFEEYGLPGWMMWLVGGLKVLLALALLAGIWIPVLIRPAALGLVVLMLGAIAMHFKIQDPLKRSVPAAIVLLMCLAIAFL